MTKRSKGHLPPTSKGQDLYLSIIDSIKSTGRTPKTSLSKQALNHYLSRLKKQGVIKRVGYGTWELTKRSKGLPEDTTPTYPSFLWKNSVRGHAFMWVLKLPLGLHGWASREKVLVSKGAHFKQIKAGYGLGQSFSFQEHKVWLLDASVVFYSPPSRSYFASSAQEAKDTALADIMALIKDLEAFLGFRMNESDTYRLKFRKEHYALVDNELARQRVKEGKTLRVRGWEGDTWLLVDASLGVPELECVHSFTAQKDADDVVSPVMNDYRDNHPPLPSEMWRVVCADANNMKQYAENMVSHVEAVKSLSAGVQELRVAVRELIEKVKTR